MICPGKMRFGSEICGFAAVEVCQAHPESVGDGTERVPGADDIFCHHRLLPRRSGLRLHFALRGFVDAESARRYLSSSLSKDLPSPFEMADMEAAVRRIVDAITKREQIGIWGDYDVDGTTGAAVLVSFLREIGAQPIYHIPHRIEEGYGLNIEGLKLLKARGVDLVITVDCGISNAREVAEANEIGLDVVVIDHHQPPEELPPAVAVVNPHRKDCHFPIRECAPPVWHFIWSSDCGRDCANMAGSRVAIRIFDAIWILLPSEPSPIWCRSEASIAR